MRCTNCGWENSGDRSNCEKCNSPLSNYAMREHAVTDVYARRTVNENIGVNAGRPTVCEQGDSGNCPQCGYPLLPGMSECPNCSCSRQASVGAASDPLNCPKCNHENRKDAFYCSHCGYELQKKEPVSQSRSGYGRKTITPWEMQAPVCSCRLSMIPNTNEETPASPLVFSGEEIILNRDNTDEGNMTITSKEQAVLTYENKKWYIQDRSEQKTTFVYTTEKIELKPGDIIVLGNRRFEFDE